MRLEEALVCRKYPLGVGWGSYKTQTQRKGRSGSSSAPSTFEFPSTQDEHTATSGMVRGAMSTKDRRLPIYCSWLALTPAG